MFLYHRGGVSSTFHGEGGRVYHPIGRPWAHVATVHGVLNSGRPTQFGELCPSNAELQQA